MSIKSKPKSEKDYYSLNPILSYDLSYMMIIGGRDIGKTFATKKFCLERWLKHREQFIYIRRNETELEAIDKDQFFVKELLEQVFKNYYVEKTETVKGSTTITFTCDCEKYGLKPENKMIITSKKVTINKEVVGYFKALSTWVKLKGSEYDQVFTMMFDEVLIDTNSSSSYLPNEINALFQLIQSIERDRTAKTGKRVRLFMLSNATNYNNIYFNYFEFEGDSSKRFHHLKKFKVVIEFPPHIGITKESNPDYVALTHKSDVAASNINNEFQERLTGNIGTIKGRKVRLYSIYHRGTFMTVYSAQGRFYVASGYDKNLTAYSFNLKDVDNGFIFLPRSHDICASIRHCFYNGILYYEDVLTKSAFSNAIQRIL